MDAGMLWFSRLMKGMGRGLPAMAGLMVAASPWSGAQQREGPIAGTWRGNSVCAVANSPCHDEVNVYRFSEIAGKANGYLCVGSKIVDGKEIEMGSTEWSYDATKHLLQTVTGNPKIQLKLEHDRLDGELLQPDKTVYRRIHLKRSGN